MKIYTHAPRENWICDRIQKEWNNSIDKNLVSIDYNNSDIIWLLAGWCWNHIPLNVLKSKKVVVTVHHIVPEKFNNQKLAEFKYRDAFVNVYHVPNETTALIVRQLTDKQIYIIPYWYDDSLWQTNLSHEQAKTKFSLPEDNFIIGSFQRDSEGETDRPKLEKGPDIFCDTVNYIRENINSNIHIFLGGWRRKYVVKRLKKLNISYTLKELADEKDLPDMYKACNLYIVSSRYEGGPQAILEASALNTPIISRNVGIAKNILDPYNIVDLPNQVFLPSNESIKYNRKNVEKFKISKHKNNFLEMFRNLI